MSDSMQVGSDELAALRARFVADVPCERCGEIDPWKRCKDAD